MAASATNDGPDDIPQAPPNMKYVLVSGGVISGIGKGVIASSTGLLLKTIGLKVSSIKIDPYLNIDAGLMAPSEHGEVFVLDDGGEVDLEYVLTQHLKLWFGCGHVSVLGTIKRVLTVLQSGKLRKVSQYDFDPGQQYHYG